MTTLTAYKPQASIWNDPFFNRVFGTHIKYQTPRPKGAPRFDLIDTTEHYVIKADIAGVKDDDVDISIHENQLKVSCMRKPAPLEEHESYWIQERHFGEFHRSFKLPKDADPEDIDASLQNGVLSIRIAKQEQSKPRKVELK